MTARNSNLTNGRKGARPGTDAGAQNSDPARSSNELHRPKTELCARKRARVLLVDDHPVMREGLARVIEAESDLMLCGQAGSIPEALEAVESSHPDLAIIDISLRGQNALELIKDIKARYPELLVLVHSMHDESLYAQRSLRAGAKGYIMKQEPPQKLVVAIRQVLAGEIYLSEGMTRELLQRAAANHPAKGASPLQQLSDREFEVFEMLGRGLGTREIAERLHLSPKTVQAHREHLKEKLGINNAASLARFAIKWTEAQS